MRTMARTRSSSVDSDTASTPARRNASRDARLAGRGRLREPAPEAAVVRCRRRAARRSRRPRMIDRADVRQLRSRAGPTSRTAMTSCRRLSRSSGRSQPGALMKSDTTKTSDRRLIALRPASSSGARSVNGALARRGCAAGRRSRRRTWTRPLRGRDRALDAAAVEHRPDPVAAPGQQPGERRRRSRSGRVRFWRSVVDRPEVDRRAQVEQEPGGDLAVLGVLADVRRRPSGP